MSKMFKKYKDKANGIENMHIYNAVLQVLFVVFVVVNVVYFLQCNRTQKFSYCGCTRNATLPIVINTLPNLFD